jgi:phage-related protein
MTNAVVTSALQEIAPGALIELFQLELNVAQHGISETLYFHAGVNQSNNDVVWNSQPYSALPIEAEGFEFTTQGTLPRPKLRISTILGTVTTLILTLPEGLEGAKVTRIRTLGRFLDDVNFSGVSTEYLLTEDGFALLYENEEFIYTEADVVRGSADPTAEFPRQIFFVDRKSAENRDVVEFELASSFDMAGIRAPKRQCITRCQWVYKSAECSYIGNLPSCEKTVDACKAHFGATAELPHGGFVGIGTFFA